MTGQAKEALRLALAQDLADFAGERAIEMESRGWASAGLDGEHHVVRLRLCGAEAGGAADKFLEGLRDREFNLKGYILADIAIVADRRDSSGRRVTLVLDALTVEAS